ncbi:MAG: Cof-type HAD-IIB family hydrolase [Bacilli bacterium]|jgi:hypothetical protein
MLADNRLLIAVDMDGTLLNSEKDITPRTQRLLRRLNRQGHLVILASGRPSRALYRYYDELALDSPLVCYNGAYVFHPKNDAFPKIEFEFPKEIVKRLFVELQPYVQNIMCENDTDIWINSEDLYLAKFFWHEGMKMHYGDITKTLDVNPMTMILQSKKDSVDEAAIRSIVDKFERLGVRFWFGLSYFEIFFKSVSKGSGLTIIADHYGIKKDNIITFGDADNDIDMFAISGISVAMKNGGPEIIKNAHRVTKHDNDNDGIYYALKQILRERKKRR